MPVAPEPATIRTWSGCSDQITIRIGRGLGVKVSPGFGFNPWPGVSNLTLKPANTLRLDRESKALIKIGYPARWRLGYGNREAEHGRESHPFGSPAETAGSLFSRYRLSRRKVFTATLSSSLSMKRRAELTLYWQASTVCAIGRLITFKLTTTSQPRSERQRLSTSLLLQRRRSRLIKYFG